MNRSFLHFHRLIAAWVSLFSLLSFSAYGSDRALLIGVGHYANPQYDLVGIDIDLDNMQVLAERLGFKEIKVIKDAEATSEKARQQIEQWLIQGTGPNDRALLYFSGHGTRIKDKDGDEEDKADEVLVMHDFNADGAEPSGMLVDDDLHKLLNRIPAKETLVLVDACHSGTATKDIKIPNLSSGSSTGQSKFLIYPGMPQGGGKEVVMAAKGESDLRYVALSAASDNEQALATEKGSLFSRALSEAVADGVSKEVARTRGMKRVKQGGEVQAAKDLTLEGIHQQVTRRIAEFVQGDQAISNSKIHHPQLSGNLELARKAILVRATPQGGGSEWSRFLNFAQSAGGTLEAKVAEGKLEEGDLLELSVEITGKKGYLNVVQVDANDKVSVLFPNAFERDNKVTKGPLALPGRHAFDWVIQEPFGRALIVAIYTRRKIDLFKASTGKRDNQGKLLEQFPTINAAATRSVVANHALYATTMEITTCEEMSQCR